MALSEGLVEAIAREARSDFETGRVPRELLASLYSVWAPKVIDLDGFLDWAIPRFPEANCGIASVYLHHRLGGVGEPIYGKYHAPDGRHGHTILHLGEGRGVDITADQFGGPRVHVGALVLPWEVQIPV